MRYLTKKDLSILIGNALDNFDTSIYAFLAPILAPAFFPTYDPVVQLILAYSVMMISIFARPLGAFIFGVIARKKGPVFGLSYSLIGVAIATVYTGFLPTYESIGWLAPLSLILVRLVRGIFAAGESTIAKMYLMEDKADSEAVKVSHLYQSSSMLGTILASGAATIVIAFQPEAWRLCFWLGGVTGFSGYFLRRYALTTSFKKIPFESYRMSTLKSIWHSRSNILRVAMGTGFGHLTYSIPFVFMNSFIPLITAISLETMMLLNTTLLVFDMVMIPIIGRWLIKFQATTVMVTAAIVLAITIVPLFNYLPRSSLSYIIFVRMWIVFWGVVFLCPLNFWFKSLFNTSDQYLLVGMGTALGASTIGRVTTPLCLWLWYVSELSVLPSLYIGFITLATAYVIQGTRQRQGFIKQAG
ncbi:MAG: MFS transporter [Alphaproteobacteria bacterium]|nr:MFS transporter [Alphaproteobacteria bacterium]